MAEYKFELVVSPLSQEQADKMLVAFTAIVELAGAMVGGGVAVVTERDTDTGDTAHDTPQPA